MSTARRRWPKAANEMRTAAIDEAGAIRVKVRAMRKLLAELEDAIRHRETRTALVIVPHLDSMLQVMDKGAEIIVIKLESAGTEEED